MVVGREGEEYSLGWFPDPSYRVAAGVRVDRGKLVIFTTMEFEDTLVVWDLSSTRPRWEEGWTEPPPSGPWTWYSGPIIHHFYWSSTDGRRKHVSPQV